MNVGLPHCSNNKLEILCELLVTFLIVFHVETQISYYVSLLCIYYFCINYWTKIQEEIPRIIKECYFVFIKLKWFFQFNIQSNCMHKTFIGNEFFKQLLFYLVQTYKIFFFNIHKHQLTWFCETISIVARTWIGRWKKNWIICEMLFIH